MVAVIWLMRETGDRNTWQVRSVFVMQLAGKLKRDSGNETWMNQPANIINSSLDLKCQCFKQ
jgi:hypothetical protein